VWGSRQLWTQATCVDCTEYCRLNLVESHFWNEESWKGKYVGIVPRRSREDKVHTPPPSPNSCPVPSYYTHTHTHTYTCTHTHIHTHTCTHTRTHTHMHTHTYTHTTHTLLRVPHAMHTNFTPPPFTCTPLLLYTTRALMLHVQLPPHYVYLHPSHYTHLSTPQT